MFGGPCTRRPLLVAAVIAVAACMQASPAGAAVSSGGTDQILSPILAELAKPMVRSKSRAQQAAILGVAPSGPGSLMHEGDRVLVSAIFDQGAIAGLDALREAGARVLDASRREQLATISIAPADLPRLGKVPGIVSAIPNRQPVLYTTSAAGEASCEGGSVISEGLGQLHVSEARELFGVQGKGMTVGVLSDSFDVATKAADGSGPVATRAKQDVISNDLPGPEGSCSDQQTPVNVLEEGPAEGEDEGRAMLQIVHDLAPHASLAFATAFQSEAGFAQNIERLARPVAEGGAGADVIVDDVAWFEEPFFQDGPVAAAINKVTAEGVNYLTSAGNDNLISEGNNIASWEAPEYRDGNCPAPVKPFLEPAETNRCMDFDPSSGEDTTFGITVAPHAILTVDLQWAEPWQGVKADLDAYLLEGSELVTAETGNNIATQRPVEILQWKNQASTSREVQLVLDRCFLICNPGANSTAEPLLKFALLENGSGVTHTEYAESKEGDVVGPTVFGHAGAASAISVAAIKYNQSTAPEPYSSRGPVTHYFKPVEGVLPAEPLVSAELIEKPDVTATDCGATTFFAQLLSSVWRFCGTSAAAPHAAAVAALLRQGDPNADQAEIRQSLVGSAEPVGTSLPQEIGAGLVNARLAIEALPEFIPPEDGASTPVAPIKTEPSPAAATFTPTPTPTPTPLPPPVTRFAKRPPSLVSTSSRTVRLSFRFASDQAGSTFLCRVDGEAFHACGAKLSRRFSVGSHVVKVKARGATGLLDPTPAVFRFRVKRLG